MSDKNGTMPPPIKAPWLKRHLNIAWLFGALLVCLIAGTLVTMGLDFLSKGNNPGYFFIWCMLPLNGWLLKQKGRSLQWLWACLFFLPWIPLVLSNKNTAVSEIVNKRTELQVDNKQQE
jgi:hypothetical protein